MSEPVSIGRWLLVRVCVAVAVALFVSMVGLVALMFLEDVLLASQELPPGTVCTVVGDQVP